MTNRREFLVGAGALAGTTLSAGIAVAESAQVINKRIRLAMAKMFAQLPQTRSLAPKAHGILVMPEVVKGGLVIGGAYGEGGLLLNDPRNGYDAPPVEYYSVASASIGLQAGVQTSSHALFFLEERALANFRRADGWEIGADAEVTFPEAGLNAQVSSTLLEKPVIGYVFGQDGFLAGISLEGAKYSRILR